MGGKKKKALETEEKGIFPDREFGYYLKRLATTGGWRSPPGWRLSILGFDGVKKHRAGWEDMRNLGMSSSRSLLLLSH